MSTELQVNYTPAKIDANFDALKQAVQAFADKHAFVVTVDNLADAKKARTELNKLIKQLNRKRIDTKKAIMVPVAEFEQRMHEVSDVAATVHRDIDGQIKTFEDKVKDDARAKLRAYQAEQWEARGVADEFRKSAIDDLVKVSALTASNKLTKASREGVDALVANDLGLQHQTHARLSELEAASYRAGLSVPLTREHVESFLFDEGSAYNSHLAAMLEREVERAQVIEDAARHEAEQKARCEIEAAEHKARAHAQAELERRDTAPAPRPDSQAVPPAQPTPDDDGKVTWDVTLTFRARANADTPRDQLQQRITERLATIGLRDIQSVHLTAAEADYA